MNKYKILCKSCYEVIQLNEEGSTDELVEIYQEFIIRTKKVLDYIYIGDLKYKIIKSTKIK